jgi:hypothetical protein
MGLHLFRSTRSGRILLSNTTDLLKSPFNKPLPPQRPIPKKKRLGWQPIPKPAKSLRFRPDLWTRFATVSNLSETKMSQLKKALTDLCVDPKTAPPIEPPTLARKSVHWKPWQPPVDVTKAIQKIHQELSKQKAKGEAPVVQWERMDYMELTSKTWPLHVEHRLLPRNRPWPEMKK